MLCAWEVGPYGKKLLAKKRKKEKDSGNAARVGKRQWRTVSSQLASSNMYSVLCPEKLGNKVSCQSNTEGVRDIWHMLWPLREVWMKIGLEKLENHKGVVVKALLDSGATGLFMDAQFAKKRGFKLEKLKNSLLVRNMDGTVNVGRAIIHQVECNMFFKGHIEKVRMDVYNLGKTEVILGMLWLAVHNPEIDWEKGKVKMIRCPPIYRRKKQRKRGKEVRKIEEEKAVKELVPKRF